MPHVEVPLAEFKVVVLGDPSVGKTSLVTRFAEGYYRENSRPATVGAFFVTRKIQSTGGVPTKIQIWDTAGAAPFRAMAPVFYGNAAAVICCYDVTRRETFEGMRGWLDEVRGRRGDGGDSGGGVVLAIAALKTDLLGGYGDGGDGTVVPEAEVQQLAEALGATYLPTSAKADHNVHALFQLVADRVLQGKEESAADGGADDGGGGAGEGGMLVDLSRSNSAALLSSSTSDPVPASPRRSQFDKYYGPADAGDAESNGKKGIGANRKADSKARTPLRRSNSKSKQKGNGGQPGAPAAAGADEGGHPLLAGGKKDRGGAKDDGMVGAGDGLACTACGAGEDWGEEGSLACVVQ